MGEYTAPLTTGFPLRVTFPFVPTLPLLLLLPRLSTVPLPLTFTLLHPLAVPKMAYVDREPTPVTALVPAPTREADCALPATFSLLSVTVRRAVAMPWVFKGGANFTLIVQLPPTARPFPLKGQLLVGLRLK